MEKKCECGSCLASIGKGDIFGINKTCPVYQLREHKEEDYCLLLEKPSKLTQSELEIKNAFRKKFGLGELPIMSIDIERANKVLAKYFKK